MWAQTKLDHVRAFEQTCTICLSRSKKDLWHDNINGKLYVSCQDIYINKIGTNTTNGFMHGTLFSQTA